MLFRTRYNVLFRQFRLLTAQAGSVPAAIRLIFENCYKRIFCASPIYGSADDFTSPLNFTPCENVTPAAKQQVGETREKAFSEAASFFPFRQLLRDYQGRAALDSCLPRLKVAGAFSGSLLARKRELSLTATALYPAPPAREAVQTHTLAKKAPQRGAFLLYHLLRERFLRRRFSEPPPATIVRKPSTMRMPTSAAMSRRVVLASVRKSDTYSLWVTRSTVPIS